MVSKVMVGLMYVIDCVGLRSVRSYGLLILSSDTTKDPKIHQFS
jgi:hypothetical protein